MHLGVLFKYSGLNDNLATNIGINTSSAPNSEFLASGTTLTYSSKLTTQNSFSIECPSNVK